MHDRCASLSSPSDILKNYVPKLKPKQVDLYDIHVRGQNGRLGLEHLSEGNIRNVYYMCVGESEEIDNDGKLVALIKFLNKAKSAELVCVGGGLSAKSARDTCLLEGTKFDFDKIFEEKLQQEQDYMRKFKRLLEEALVKNNIKITTWTERNEKRGDVFKDNFQEAAKKYMEMIKENPKFKAALFQSARGYLSRRKKVIKNVKNLDCSALAEKTSRFDYILTETRDWVARVLEAKALFDNTSVKDEHGQFIRPGITTVVYYTADLNPAMKYVMSELIDKNQLRFLNISFKKRAPLCVMGTNNGEKNRASNPLSVNGCQGRTHADNLSGSARVHLTFFQEKPLQNGVVGPLFSPARNGVDQLLYNSLSHFAKLKIRIYELSQLADNPDYASAAALSIEMLKQEVFALGSLLEKNGSARCQQLSSSSDKSIDVGALTTKSGAALYH